MSDHAGTFGVCQIVSIIYGGISVRDPALQAFSLLPNARLLESVTEPV